EREHGHAEACYAALGRLPTLDVARAERYMGRVPERELIDDHFHDQCGVFGAPEAANLTYLGLHALQHRGQESAGIVSADAGKLLAHRALGLVQDVFD